MCGFEQDSRNRPHRCGSQPKISKTTPCKVAGARRQGRLGQFLTRRANQRHCFIIAQSVKRPPDMARRSGSHVATVASLADPQNGRTPRHITLQCCDLALPLQLGRNRAQQAMIAWRQRAGPAERSQGRKPAEPVARSASLDGAPLVRQRPPMRSWPDIMPSTRGKPLRCDGWRSGY